MMADSTRIGSRTGSRAERLAAARPGGAGRTTVVRRWHRRAAAVLCAMALGGPLVSAGLGSLPAGASRVASVTPVALPGISAPPDVVVGEASGHVTLPVTLSAPGTKTVSVKYRTTNSTALASTGCDYNYESASGTLTFTPGQTTKSVAVTLLNCDTSTKIGFRSFTFTLSTPVNGTIVRASTRVDIVGDGDLTTTPDLYVRDATVDHDAGTIEVPVLLGGPAGTASNSTVTVHYATHDGTAVAGTDYTSTSGTLTFGPGETAENVTVPITDRTGTAPTRRFTVTLSSPTAATIVDGTGVVTIGASGATPLALPDISAPPDVVVGEADGYVTLPVTLSAPGTKTVSVKYPTVNSTALSSTGCDYNYVGVTGTLIFVPGETTKVVRVDLLNCDLSTKIGFRSFTFNLSTPVNGAIVRASTRVDIVGDGDLTTNPDLYVRDATVDHDAGTIEVPVLLGGPAGTASNSTVTVHYATHDGTALAGTDYTSTSGTLTFGPGETAENVTVPITDRTGTAPTRRFTVTLSSPTAATIVDGTGVVTIGASGATPLALPDISAPPDVVVGEADGYVTLPVTLSAPGTKTVSVKYQTTNSTALSSTGCDYNYVGVTGTLIYVPGETTKVVRVDLLNCDLSTKIGFRSFTFNLSTPVNGAIVRASTRVDIVGDGDLTTTPDLYVRDATVDHDAGTIEVPVLLGGPAGTASNSTVTVHYATHDGTALAGTDYTSTSGTLTFGPGETAENVTVPIIDRTGTAPTRRFTVTLSSPTAATIVDGTGVVTIGASGATPLALPDISAPPDVVVGEADGYVTLPVTLSAPGTKTVSVKYRPPTARPSRPPGATTTTSG